MIQLNLIRHWKPPYGLVYVFTNVVNGKQYVGQTVQTVADRWESHCVPISQGNHCYAIGSAVDKYGKKAFSFRIVAHGYDRNDLDSKEACWVARLNTMSPNGYNLTAGGGSAGKPSHETIEKRRQALLGHPTSQETREKIRATQIGRPLSPEHCAALSVPKKHLSPEGLKKRAEGVRKAYANMTPEKRAQFGQHRKGTKHTEETLTKMREKARARAAKNRLEKSNAAR